jgi:hypothetical protein
MNPRPIFLIAQRMTLLHQSQRMQFPNFYYYWATVKKFELLSFNIIIYEWLKKNLDCKKK